MVRIVHRVVKLVIDLWKPEKVKVTRIVSFTVKWDPSKIFGSLRSDNKTFPFLAYLKSYANIISDFITIV